MTPVEPVQAIRTLLESQHFAVLATSHQGAPYTSLVAFSGSPDLRQIYLVTNRATRKYANLSQDERVSVLIDDTVNRESDLVDAAAVTALGTIRELVDEERATALKPYLERHPRLADFTAAKSCALLAVQVEKFILVRRFQQVFEYRP